MKTDLAFFMRKARAHTPNTSPPSDDELRGGQLSMNFLPLLTTGAFSDVKLLVDKTVFRCHRTVLAARSPVFRTLFDQGGDGGSLRIGCSSDPRAMARFLQYIYGSVLTGRNAVDIAMHFELCNLAREYKITALHHHHVACLARRMTHESKDWMLAAAPSTGDAVLAHALALALAALEASTTSTTTAHACGNENGCGPARRVSSSARRALQAPY